MLLLDSTTFTSLAQWTATPEPFAFLLDDLLPYRHAVPDPRQPRGCRYPLAPLLALALVAKLATYAALTALAHWTRLRAAELTAGRGLPRRTLPHPTTWTRLFAALDVTALEQQVAAFFTHHAARTAPQRGLQLTLAGKTLRGTLPAGSTQGVHLVVAYLPAIGCVLAELAVSRKANELTVAPTLLAQLALDGRGVTGDALCAQRNLSAQIVAASGDYLWTVKANQPALLDEIRWLFAPLQPGEQASDWDWRTARTVTSGHGRIEERTLVASGALATSSDWPGLAQGCQLPVRRTDTRHRRTTESVRYGVTSVSAAAAGPAALLGLVRGHWEIAGGLQQRRAVTLGEDASQVRAGHAPQVLACLNNVVIGLMSLQGGGTWRRYGATSIIGSTKPCNASR
ncbi:MAG: ISAs1 family transposase [Chloroflexota bacterium]|nr:ISAs1 family transposase [Chloroflexota bacterium]